MRSHSELKKKGRVQRHMTSARSWSMHFCFACLQDAWYIIKAIDLGLGQPVAANTFRPSGGTRKKSRSVAVFAVVVALTLTPSFLCGCCPNPPHSDTPDLPRFQPRAGGPMRSRAGGALAVSVTAPPFLKLVALVACLASSGTPLSLHAQAFCSSLLQAGRRLVCWQVLTGLPRPPTGISGSCQPSSHTAHPSSHLSSQVFAHWCVAVSTQTTPRGGRGRAVSTQTSPQGSSPLTLPQGEPRFCLGSLGSCCFNGGATTHRRGPPG